MAWTVAKDLAAWIGQARAAAKSKREQRYAHVVEHAGVLVAGLRRLNSRANALLLPLSYFDPSTWDMDRRETVATNLIRFAHEDEVLPRMRASLAALGPAIAALGTDEDASAPARSIFETVERLFVLPAPRGQGDTAYGADAGVVLDRAVGREPPPLWSETGGFFYDVESLQPRLEIIIDKLRTATTSEETRMVRDFAALLLTAPADRHGVATSQGALATHAQLTQQRFGELLGFQQRWFPTMPPPDWVWES